jgi:methylated-DNA-protein-cysteine methyltransferase-like protein
MARRLVPSELNRRLLRTPPRNPETLQREEAIRETIRQIPKGKVASYSQVAAAAGYPMYHREVARVLRNAAGLPWQRVVGSGGFIKLHLDMALEQRMRLEREGVTFRGKRVDLEKHQHVFRQWDFR